MELHDPDDSDSGAAPSVRSVVRALALLSAIGEGTRLTGQLQRAAGIPGPTAIRLLRTMEQAGYVARTADGFTVGPEIIKLFFAVEPDSTTWKLIRAAVDELRGETGETAQFMIESAGMREVVYVAESDHGVRRVLRVGGRYQLHHGASGKLFVGYGRLGGTLSALADSEGMYITRSGQRRPVAKLEQDGAEARQSGVAHAIGPESWAVAAPILRDGVLLGAISVGVPGSRYSDEFLEQCRSTCRDIAQRTSSVLDRLGEEGADNACDDLPQGE